MGAPLPDLALEEFAARLAAVCPGGLKPEVARDLHLHYVELRRWNPALSLVGPGTAAEVVERHYGEALAALPLLPPGAASLVDVGSGAGFPGWALAAARRDLEVTLVESQERKWAFLRACGRKVSLPCRCLHARVALPLPRSLPERYDLLTMRALKIPRPALDALLDRLGRGGRFLLWAGEEEPEVPPPWKAGRILPLPGSERRKIVEFL